MRSKLRVAGICLFLALSLFLAAFGTLYSSVQNLLWFHAAAVPEHALEDIRPLYFALMRLIGGASGALGLLGVYVALVPMRKGAPHAATALAIANAIALSMAATAAETLAAATGAPTSWHIMGALMAINIAAWTADFASRRAPARHPVEA